MAENTTARLHVELFQVRKEITTLSKDQAATSNRLLELTERQERLEAELAELRGSKKG